MVAAWTHVQPQCLRTRPHSVAVVVDSITEGVAGGVVEGLSDQVIRL